MSTQKKVVDICFGPNEQMLRWAQEENLPVRRDKDGNYDWEYTYEAWLIRNADSDDNETNP